jgi:hypothetical protein
MGGATLLCTNHPGPSCVEPSLIHLISEGKIVILNSFQQVECNLLLLVEHLKGLAAAGSGGQVGHFPTESSKYTSCEPCSATSLSGGLVNILRTGHEKATATFSPLKTKITCFLFFNCVYTWAGVVGEVLGPLLSANGTSLIHFNKAPIKSEGGGLCPPTAELDALFSSLALFYIQE